MPKGYLILLKHPRLLLALTLAMALAFMVGIKDFSFDASADTLVIEGDPALIRYNEMADLFGGDDFVVLTYTADNVFTAAALSEIAELQSRLAALPSVASTYSILDAPLIESPPIPLEHIAEDYQTLRKAGVDLDLAKAELTRSPLISDYLLSTDGTTTAISAILRRDTELDALRAARTTARQTGTGITEAEAAYDQHRTGYVEKRDELISALRAVKENYNGDAVVFMSGVPMIAADMLSYVKADLGNFGLLVLLLIVCLLSFFFRKPRWVLIPIAICMVTVGITMGILGFMKTPVTVVSSNFIALLAIISISFSIHLIVRYRELLAENLDMGHRAMIVRTMRSKFAPCAYTALTTMLAFGSMLGSDIVPIIDFGWMMCLGVVVAFIVTYLLFPALLLILGPAAASKTMGARIALTEWFDHLAVDRTYGVVGFSAIAGVVVIYGVSLINFDNRFIDYFKPDTDIYQGMRQIDQHLGGTLPLDVYVKFEADTPEGDDFFFDDFDDDFPERYWFTPDKIDTLRQIQEQLESRPEIGKVISLVSMEQMARQFNDGEPLSGLEIVYVLGELPREVRDFLIEPYAKPAEGWMRINARIRESNPDFSKDELISDITEFAENDAGLSQDRFLVTGMVVLFNDMLQQLADSQARTLAYVIGATFIMFSLLLQSVKLAVIAIVPNALAALSIIAFMGYAGIQMDMMTVTTAAICIGIGVDDAIHYLHRYQEELRDGLDPVAAVKEAHHTIGRAMYFTTVTIMVGFSVLALSNFVPTVNFGLLTALAMVLALVANMTLMPALIVLTSRDKTKAVV